MMILDYTQHHVCSNTVYSRIISLVPSTTESVTALGATDRLIAVTRFCIHPASITRKLPKIGGTKNIDMTRIDTLKPDLILANAEENTKEDILTLRKKGYNVYVSFPKSIEEALAELKKLALLLQAPYEKLCAQIKDACATRPPFSYLYLIWNKPLMSVSSDCFIASMLSAVGGINKCPQTESRYPSLSTIPMDIDCLLLSSEPFPFREKHRQQLHHTFQIPLEKIIFIDGEYCSWHGTRMLEGLRYLNKWSEQQCFSLS